MLTKFMRKASKLTKKAFNYYSDHGFRSLVVKSRAEILKKLSPPPNTVPELLKKAFVNTAPISHYTIERKDLRLNLVTDSLRKESFFGGVATSLILATLFSNQYHIPLRIISRRAENCPGNYFAFLDLLKIKRPEQIEFFSDHDREGRIIKRKLETSDHDIYLATSWWTAHAIEGVNLRNSFFYLLQEVEPFFYPNGDEQLLCEETIKNPQIKFLLNSKLLSDFYEKSGESHITENSRHFEPAFPLHLYSPGELSFKKKEKFKLFFYARPNNPRNLFYTGIKLIEEAFQRGILNKEEWEIVFAGAKSPAFQFSNGVKPTVCGQMDLKEYIEFIKTIDLGFSMIYTPHPSYPPLEIAAAGGVVLTNRYRTKQVLEYSKNIITEDLNTNAMMRGFEKAVQLAKNPEKRKSNFLSNQLSQSWEESLKPILAYMNENK